MTKKRFGSRERLCALELFLKMWWWQYILSPRKLHPLLEEKDPKNDSPKNYSFWTFAAHTTQIPPKKYNFT